MADVVYEVIGGEEVFLADKVVKYAYLAADNFRKPPNKVFLPLTPITLKALHTLHTFHTLLMGTWTTHTCHCPPVHEIDVTLRHFLHGFVGEVLDEGVDAVHINAQHKTLFLTVGQEMVRHLRPVDQN